MIRFAFLLFAFLFTGCQISDIQDQPPAHRKEKPPAPTTPLTVSQLIGNGAYIMLSDNTIWAIHPSDQILSGGWISAAQITIKQGTDATYPFLLYNSLTDDTVRARKSSIEEVRQRIRVTETQKQQNLLEQQKTQQKSQELYQKAPTG